MTSQRSNVKKPQKAGFCPFLGFTLKQSWTLILLFTIVTFFALPVFTVMGISSNADSYRRAGTYTLERMREAMVEGWLPSVHTVVIPLGCIFAVVAVCKQFSFIKNKVATDFYHSLPLRRGQLYLSGIAVAFLSVIIPFAVNTLLTLGVLAANGLVTAQLTAGLFMSLADMLGYSVFCLAVTTIVSTVTGLTSVTLALTAEAIAIVPAGLAVFTAFFYIFTENMWVDYYLNENVLKYTSPLLRAMLDGSHLSFVEISLILLASAAMLVGGYYIYRKRKNERAGTPVVFNTLGEVIKYINMVLVALFAGFAFHNVMGRSIVWTVFGMVCGGVLTFMLMNTVLTKNAKAMFSGTKGLGIYGAAMAAFTAVMIINPFSINSRIPDADSISSVKVSFSGAFEGMEFTDEAVIGAIHRMYTEGNAQQSGRYDDLYMTVSDSVRYTNGDAEIAYASVTESVSMDVVFYPKFGLPVAKELYIPDKYQLIEEFRIMLDSREFGEQYAMLAEQYAKGTDTYVHVSATNYVMGTENDILWYDPHGVSLRLNRKNAPYQTYSEKRYTMASIGVDDTIADAKNANFDWFQTMTYGTVSISGGNGGIFTDVYIPLRTDAKAAQDKLSAEGVLVSPISEQTERLTECISEIKVYKADTVITKENEGEELPHALITDKEQIREILAASSNILLSDSGNGTFAFNDREYFAMAELSIVYGNDAKECILLTPEEIAEREASGELMPETRSFQISFRYGMTPDFIDGYFK